MKWASKEIPSENIPQIISQGRDLAKAGNPIVNQYFCVYTLEDDPLLYYIPLLDFLDNIPDKKFITFKLYQVQ